MWNGIIYQFPYYNGCTVEGWEWISNFIPHFIGYVIIHPGWDLNPAMLKRGAPGLNQLTYKQMVTHGLVLSTIATDALVLKH